MANGTRIWSSRSPTIIEHLVSALSEASSKAARGEYVRYIRSTYLPDESRCMCWFEAPSAEAVAEVNEVAKVPFDRILEAIEFTPEA